MTQHTGLIERLRYEPTASQYLSLSDLIASLHEDRRNAAKALEAQAREIEGLRKDAALVAARERERLNFLCSTDKPRRIEHHKGLWRVYQDAAAAEAEHSDWQAMTYLFHATPDEAIDAAIRALNTEGEGNV